MTTINTKYKTKYMFSGIFILFKRKKQKQKSTKSVDIKIHLI